MLRNLPCVLPVAAKGPTTRRGESVRFLRQFDFGGKLILRVNECCCSDAPLFITENIRKAPPTGDEWWETACESNDSQDDEEDYSDDGNTDAYDTVAINALSQEKRFHNCGLKTWHKVRKEWTKRTVESLPPRPTAAEYSQLVKGLTKHSSMRTYELPRRMALSDLISVYNDIWEGDGM